MIYIYAQLECKSTDLKEFNEIYRSFESTMYLVKNSKVPSILSVNWIE